MIVSYKFDELVPAIQAVMPHCAGKNEVSEIITGIHIAADGTLLATDRFTVGRYKPESFEVEGEGEFEGFTLSPAAVLWLSKFKMTGPGDAIAVWLSDEVDGPNVRILMVDAGGNAVQQGVFPLLTGNYPPVARLFPDDDTPFRVAQEVTQLSLKTAFLIRIDKAVKAVKAVKVLNPRETNGCARFRFMPTENPNKPGPVYVQVGDRFDALIQPNLLLR